MCEAQQLSFRQSKRDVDLSTRCLFTAFGYLGLPESMSDFGCGPGHLVNVANNLGVSAKGVDLFVDRDEPTFYQRDLNKEYIELAAEMVICWELAEHLDESRADLLCAMLQGSTQRVLLFSAATVDQGGSGHVNEQPHAYWIDKFGKLGMQVDAHTSQLRRAFLEVAPRAYWYGKNLIVFVKE